MNKSVMDTLFRVHLYVLPLCNRQFTTACDAITQWPCKVVHMTKQRPDGTLVIQHFTVMRVTGSEDDVRQAARVARTILEDFGCAVVRTKISESPLLTRHNTLDERTYFETYIGLFGAQDTLALGHELSAATGFRVVGSWLNVAPYPCFLNVRSRGTTWAAHDAKVQDLMQRLGSDRVTKVTSVFVAAGMDDGQSMDAQWIY